MLHRIVELNTLPELKLSAMFENGERRIYDVAPLIPRWPAFRPLEDVPGLFEVARTDMGGLGVVWNDEIDIASDEIWENGIKSGCRG
ncbi:MAG: DUF2442 domain-containing protein [Clostridiales Family XIII bacterium]|jgi:hypothetical protein|nr:DUF2442 domain-containing protein [Clostridiales Family XIII bacterium]